MVPHENASLTAIVIVTNAIAIITKDRNTVVAVEVAEGATEDDIDQINSGDGSYGLNDNYYIHISCIQRLLAENYFGHKYVNSELKNDK